MTLALGSIGTTQSSNLLPSLRGICADITAFEFDLSVTAGLGDVISLAFRGAFFGLTVNNFTGCFTVVDGNKICADYTGSIRMSGIEIKTCEINIGPEDCNCQICGEKGKVKYECPSPHSELTTLGICVSPLFVDT